MATSEDRSRPNILITGTPGTGKTCTSELVSEMTGFKHLNVGSLVSNFQTFDDSLSKTTQYRNDDHPLAVSDRFDE